ncbi:MAG: GAF domain-containing sensor histidine kinase [Deltaproteobacteria bacterium]|nr:GAF domain-containing sensor histidine kinase [Deltaproteobacteria bacterium]
MANPVPDKIKRFFDDMVWEEPLSKEKLWVLLRWVLLGVVILATLIVNSLIGIRFPVLKIAVLCGLFSFLNALFHYTFFFSRAGDSVPDPRLMDRFAIAQFACDWGFLTLILHYTGGIASPFLFYALFHVLLSGVLLEEKGFLFYVTLISCTLILLSILELTGLVSHYEEASFIFPGVQRNVYFVLILLFFCITALYISSTFVAWLLKRGRERILRLLILRKKLEQANKELTHLNQLARGIDSTLGLYPRLDFICQSITGIMKIKGVVIRLLDERTNRLELVSACGLSEEYINKGPVDADRSLARALEGEPHFVPDAVTDPSLQYPDAARREGIASMLAYPLRGREKVIGTMRLYMAEKRTFSQNEMDFIASLANQVSISIENAKFYDVLERQDKAKTEFIMMMTHELKGPLMAMQNLLEVLLKGYVGDLSEKQRELVDRIYRRIDSVMEVSTGLLDIYQWESQRAEAKWTPLSLREQLQRAMDMFRGPAEEKGLELDLALPEEDPLLLGSEDEMEKILNNLLTNAIKYTPRGGRISLSLSSQDDRAIITVGDSGIGMEPEDRDRIFQDFFRTKEAKQIDPYGRGMGLPFVKRVVETLGGTIEVKSEKGKGSEFLLTFPRHHTGKSRVAS